MWDGPGSQHDLESQDAADRSATGPDRRPSPRSPLSPAGTRIAALVLLGCLIAWRYGPVLAALDTSLVDFEALHGSRLFTEGADSRLNAWILDWVQRTALTHPSTVLDTNAFHPAKHTLTGSEHLLGLAVQLLPFRPWAAGAIGLHQIALVLSTLLLAATTFLAVWSWTRSTLGAFIAAASAVLMPWRITELSHLQLSSVQWFPLIWWLLIRGLYRDPTRLERLALGVCVAIQLLSSFYLAYYLTLSCGLLLLGIGLQGPARRRRIPAVLLSLLPGYLLFGLSALPYLSRRASAELAPGWDPTFSLGIDGAWSLLAPRLPSWIGAADRATLDPTATYDLPIAVLVLAVISVAFALRRSFWQPEVRAATAGLAAVALCGFVFAIGGSFQIGETTVPLPSQLLALVLPGFDMLRGPARWAILSNAAVPLLAGIGVASLVRVTPRRFCPLVAASCVLAAAASFEWFAIPARPAWPDPDAVARRYAAVRALPPGPLMEIPFSLPLRNAELGARAMLGSTLHWRPIVNGYTGHAPASHALLQRLSERLPEARVVRQFGGLTGVRYFVIDRPSVAPAVLATWQGLTRDGLLTLRFDDAATRIYELRGSDASGHAAPALLAQQPGPQTLTGLPRTPLDLAEGAARLTASLPARQRSGVPNRVRLRVDNRSAQPWPGLDVHREALVLLRYDYRPIDEPGARATRLVPLDRDIAAGESVELRVWLRAPFRSGSHELCIDLVQQLAGELVALPAAPVTRRVALTRPAGLNDLHEILARYELPPPHREPCGSAGETRDQKPST